MSVLILGKEKLPEIKYKIGNGSSAIIYKTNEDMVLKRYCNNMMYKKILELHENFLDYLIELSKLDNEILVVPKDIYIKRSNIVAAQTYPYQKGMIINSMYPKTDLLKFLDALEEFYENLKLIDYLKLRDMHYENIVYTGKICLIDLDFSTFTDNKLVIKENIAHINEYIIRGVFGLDVKEEYVVDSKLTQVLESTLNGEITSVSFFKEYRNLLLERYGKCQYVKHLTKDFIKSK